MAGSQGEMIQAMGAVGSVTGLQTEGPMTMGRRCLCYSSPSTSIKFDKNSTVKTMERQIVTLPLKYSAIRLHSVVFPELPGPNRKILHGGMGIGGRRQGRGFSENNLSVSSEERQYILPRKLKIHRKSKRQKASCAGLKCRL